MDKVGIVKRPLLGTYRSLFRVNVPYKISCIVGNHVRLIHRSGVVAHLKLSDVEIVEKPC